MARFFLNFGKLLMISRRQRTVRKSVVFVFTNLLFLTSLIFLLEIALIILGLDNIVLPIPFLTGEFVSNLLFWVPIILVKGKTSLDKSNSNIFVQPIFDTIILLLEKL